MGDIGAVPVAALLALLKRVLSFPKTSLMGPPGVGAKATLLPAVGSTRKCLVKKTAFQAFIKALSKCRNP